MKVYCRVEFHKSSWLRLAVEKAVPDAMKGYHADLAIEIRKWVDTRRGLFGVDLDEVDEGLVAASGGGGDTVSILSGSDGLRSEHSSIKSSSPLPDAHDPGSSKSTVSGNTVTAAAVQEITSSNERVLVTEEQALQALIVLIRYVGVSRALASLFISLFLISASINVAIVVWMMY